MVKIMSATDSGLVKTGKCLHICEDFLLGTCFLGLSCPAYHTLLPFHWQFQCKSDGSWHSIPLVTQLHLEMCYSDPNQRILYLNDNTGIPFILDLQLNLLLNCHLYIAARRLSCLPSSVLFHSKVLYWCKDFLWVEHKKELQEKINFGEDKMFLMIINGEKTMFNLKESWQMTKNSKYPLLLKPEYLPLHQIVHKIKNKKKLVMERPHLNCIERHLFHQTDVKLEDLALCGFEPAQHFSVDNFGTAIYFTKEAKASTLMTSGKVSFFGHKMILAKVLIGEMTVEKPDFLAPPNPGEIQFDCYVNNTQNPTLFAVSKKHYCYLYYVIEYKNARDAIYMSNI